MTVKLPQHFEDLTLRPRLLPTPEVEKPSSEVLPVTGQVPQAPLDPNLAVLPTEGDRTVAVGHQLDARAVANRLRFGGLAARDLLEPLVLMVQSDFDAHAIDQLIVRLKRAFPVTDDLTKGDAAALCRARDLICELTDAGDRRSPRMDRVRAFFNERQIRFHRTDELPEDARGFEIQLTAFRQQLEDWRDGPKGKHGPVIINRHRARVLATTIANLADDRQVLAVKSMLAQVIDPRAKGTGYEIVFADRNPEQTKAAEDVVLDALRDLSSTREPMAGILVAARRGTGAELLRALEANGRDKETLAFARRYLGREAMRKKMGPALSAEVDAFLKTHLPEGTWTRYDTKVDLDRQFRVGKISRKELRLGKAAALTSATAADYQEALRFSAALAVQVFFSDLLEDTAAAEEEREEEDHRQRLEIDRRDQAHRLEHQRQQRVEVARVEVKQATTQPSMRLARGRRAELLAIKQELFHRIDQATTIEELMSILGKLNAREGEASAARSAATHSS